MAAYNILHQHSQQQGRHHPLILAPSPPYNPPWPAYEHPDPLTLRLTQLSAMPRSELCRVPAAELIQVRNFQAGRLEDYQQWASQQRFGRVEHLNRCATMKAQLVRDFDNWMRLSAMHASDEGYHRALHSQELAEQRFPAIFSWLENVQRAAPSGFLEETDGGDAGLQVYQSRQRELVSAWKAKKTTSKSTEKQNKIKKTTSKRRKISTRSENEALLTSLQASLPKGSRDGFYANLEMRLERSRHG